MAGAAQHRDRTRAAGVGVSLVLHAAALSWLGLRVVPAALRAAPPPEPAPMTVELVRPRPLPQSAPATAAPRAMAPREVPELPRPRSAAPIAPRLTPEPLPLPPVRSGGGGTAAETGGAGPIGAGSAPGPRPGVEMQSDLRGFLRSTLGCSHEVYLRLTPTERARCDTGFATAAKTAPTIPLSDDKLAEYARGADANARRRARREGSLYQPVVACQPGQAGSNLGLGCLPPDAVHGVAKF